MCLRSRRFLSLSLSLSLAKRETDLSLSPSLSFWQKGTAPPRRERAYSDSLTEGKRTLSGVSQTRRSIFICLSSEKEIAPSAYNKETSLLYPRQRQLLCLARPLSQKANPIPQTQNQSDAFLSSQGEGRFLFSRKEEDISLRKKERQSSLLLLVFSKGERERERKRAPFLLLTESRCLPSLGRKDNALCLSWRERERPFVLLPRMISP